MDPFSITVGVISLLDISVRLTKHVNRFWEEVVGIDQEIKGLIRSLKATESTVNSFNQVKAQLKQTPSSQSSSVSTAPDLDPIEHLWRNADVMQDGCRDELVKMGTILLSIRRDKKPKDPEKECSKKVKDPSKFSLGYSKLRKQLRKQSKEEEYDNLRRNLDHFLQTFQILLHMIQL